VTPTLLVVDDDARILRSLERALEGESFAVRSVASAEEALSDIGKQQPDVVLTDVRMTGMDGIELLKLLRSRAPSVDVMVMTAHDDLPLVATAMREGATDFLQKPLDLHHLRTALGRAFEDREARRRRDRNEDDADSSNLVGRDPRMVAILKVVGQVSRSRTNVIVRGESGTGKELIARAIHDSSPYAAEPFVAVNCTALPATLLESELFGHRRGSFTGATSDRRGRFSQAGKGTLFLDEIGDTPLDFQAKLLRVLQEREYYPVGADVPERAEARVITATHRNLEKLVGSGAFREDLYYRLRVVEIEIPPLRARAGDVPVLAERLLAKAAAAAGRPTPSLSTEALNALIAHSWPGNVRELENALMRAVVLAPGNVIRPEHLALSGAGGNVPTDEALGSLEVMEREHVARVLKSTDWHKARAAKILGVSRPRLDRLIEKYSLGGEQ
jgi:DNA-binding NtrC family response regulator